MTSQGLIARVRAAGLAARRTLQELPAEPRATGTRTGPQHLATVTALLIAGALLLLTGLAEMSRLLYYDEAYYGLDALSLLHEPRLTPFFADNLGRESAWMYFLAPFVQAFGANSFALHLAAAFVGILTLAATYRLARELLPRGAATWALAAMAVFYYHVHMSHLALRATLLPLAGALTVAAVFRARRTGRLGAWLVAGACLGALAYTYIAARVWIAYLLLMPAWWIWHEPAQRRHIIAAGALAALIALPLGIYMSASPDAALGRIQMVAVLSKDALLANLGAWLAAWFGQGDLAAVFNLPGRPILDPYLGALFLLGLAGLAVVTRKAWHAAWILGLAIVSIVPSLFSEYAPHFLRAIGVVVPVALILGSGAWVLQHALNRLARMRLAPQRARQAAALIPLALLALAGTGTYYDFDRHWLGRLDVYITMEKHVNAAIDYVEAQLPTDMPVYFTPFSPDHPVLQFRQGDMAPRPVGAFDGHLCLVLPDRPAAYVALTMYQPDFEAKLSPWASVSLLVQEKLKQRQPPQFTIFQAVPSAEARVDRPGTVEFGDRLALRSLAPLPETASPGSLLSLTLGLHGLRQLDQAYSVFVHVYGAQGPEQGGSLLAQGDSEICATYPAPAWKPNETVIQDFVVPLPPDLAPGHYRLALGVYASYGDHARLPVTAPASPVDYVVVHEFDVVPEP